jgi:uncharacterized protein (DUF2252 family)
VSIDSGRDLRRDVPRSAHAVWKAPADRLDPLDILTAQDAVRLPNIVPLRYQRMLASPFGFVRGAAAVMAADLASTPASGILVHVCGDAHLGNFGIFATPERRLVFDVDDFDETTLAPWEWDVKRLAASLALVARGLGIARRDAAGLVRRCVRAYRTRLRVLAAQPVLEAWYARIDARIVAAELPVVGGRARTGPALPTVSGRDGVSAIAEKPPLLTHVDDDTFVERGNAIMRAYMESVDPPERALLERYTPVDIARKIQGVGSVGLRSFAVLLTGNGQNDTLFLQLKQAEASVLEAYAGPSRFANHGRRVVVGQRILQAYSDPFLGFTENAGIDYYVRRILERKGAVDFASLDAPELGRYANLCALALAHAHVRSKHTLEIVGYLGTARTFDRAVAEFAESYADQTEKDHARLVEAVAQGRIHASAAVVPAPEKEGQ